MLPDISNEQRLPLEGCFMRAMAIPRPDPDGKGYSSALGLARRASPSSDFSENSGGGGEAEYLELL